MKKIRLTEKDLQRIVKRVISEMDDKTEKYLRGVLNHQDNEGEKKVNPNIDYHRSRHTDDDSEYEWAQDDWGYLQNPKDNRSYEDEDDFEEVDSFDDYDEYIKSGYCHPHDETCMRERAYFERRVNDYGRPLKIYRRHKKR